MREKDNLLKVFPEFICGEDFFGLSEPTVQRMIESVSLIFTPFTYSQKNLEKEKLVGCKYLITIIV